MDVDVPKETQPHGLSPSTDPGSIPTLDGWIENLMSCKQLAENDVQRLCDRVCIPSISIMKGAIDIRAGQRSTTGRVQRPTSGELHSTLRSTFG